MPDDNSTYSTKRDAVAALVQWKDDARESGQRVTGNARTGYVFAKYPAQSGWPYMAEWSVCTDECSMEDY